MEYKRINPTPDLLHTVESYIFLTTDKSASFTDTFFPNGKPAIVFHFKSPFSIKNNKDEWETMPKISLVGCQSVPVTLKNEGTIDSLTVLLYPYSLYNLFKIRVEGLLTYLDGNQYFPDDFFKKLTTCPEIEKRAELLDGFFIEKLANYSPEADSFKAICDCIITKKGQIERKDMAESFALSENYIHKLFIKKMGISFKPYAQIVRISNIINDVYFKNTHDWIELLLEYGYYDQAHFIKDFKKITGKTPLQYYKSDKTLTSIFSGLA